MKKLIAVLVTVLFILSCFLSCNKENTSTDKDEVKDEVTEEKGTKLTLDNYEQYLTVKAVAASGENPRVICKVEPATTNYDFTDVKIVLRAYGEYTVVNHTYLGYTTNGLATYSDYAYSNGEQEYDETFELRINIGGSLIEDEKNSVDLYMPEGEFCGPGNYLGTPTVNPGEITCEYEIISIEGNVAKS